MIRGLYTAASGMLANERMQEIVSNNLANVNTPGYKQQDGELMSFPEQLLYRVQYGKGIDSNVAAPDAKLGTLGTGVWLQESLTRFSEGNIQKSDQPYDYAIVDNAQNSMTGQGPASFFAVYDPAKADALLTRIGHFERNADNLLVTSSGQRLLAVDAKGQPILNSGVQVQDDGSLKSVVVDASGKPTGKPFVDSNGKPIALENPNGVSVVDVADPNQLIPYGNNGYVYNQATLRPGTAEVRHGFIEGSNVDPTQTMVTMMNVMRSYEANSKVIHTEDSTMEKAANEIGKVS
jgi:flagellar basal-body rod protein FlgF